MIGMLIYPTTIAPVHPGVFGGHPIQRVGIVHVGVVFPNPGEVVHIYIHLYRGADGLLYAGYAAGPVMLIFRY